MSRVEIESVETRNKLRVEGKYKRFSRGGFFFYSLLSNFYVKNKRR